MPVDPFNEKLDVVITWKTPSRPTKLIINKICNVNILGYIRVVLSKGKHDPLKLAKWVEYF